jgi:hypothetical protein
MTNAELIKALRWCGGEHNGWCVDETYKCPLWSKDRRDKDMLGDYCKEELMTNAAYALESAEKRIAEMEKSYEWKAYAALEESIEGYKTRIAELESQLSKEGEWIQMNGHRYCNVCGHKDSPILTNYLQNWKRSCPYCGARIKTT